MDNIPTIPDSISSDSFLFKLLPSCDAMLEKILRNSNCVYYPCSSSDQVNYKPFDFSSQKVIGDNEDDFVSIDQKQANVSKSKGKVTAKKTPAAATGAKKGQGKVYPNQQPKFKVTQTINPQSDWKVIADFNKLTLEKLKLDNIEPEAEDKLIFGSLYKLSEDCEDKINPLNPATLQRYENVKFFGNISTLEDEKMKTGTDIANVFVTEKILSVIMTCVYNSRPWHLKITKLGDKIFIDKMSNSDIDLVTVNESDNIPSEEEDKNIDNFRSLSIEATLINEFIKEQVLDLNSLYDEIDGPSPFVEEGEASVEHLAYKYRVWKIGDIEVLVRCQVHAFDYDDEGNVKHVNIYALNEFDKTSFLSKETQSMSHLLKKELQNNHLKITKWGVNCYLAGVDTIKMGFVTRKNLKSNQDHLISGFYEVNCNDLLQVTNFNKSIAWGIFKQIIEIVRNQSDGTFILTKTLATSGPKSMVKLYRLPAEAPIEMEEAEY